MKQFILSLFLIISLPLMAQLYINNEPMVNTYSIVARDSVTGDIGVAVQSHWFNVGGLVIYAKPGVGVVATQSLVKQSYGPQGLDLMSMDISPEKALAQLIKEDPAAMYRQVAFLDDQGRTASHTGSLCIGEAGHKQGPNYAVQANMMLNNTVWQAMAYAFENTSGTLAERIIASLKAAQNAGGDIRGKQSAAILIVKGTNVSGNSWEDTLMDLRVEDHPNPVKELERLVQVHKAYDFMNKGDLAMEDGDTTKAESLYLSAQQMFPENLEMQYWYAINLLNNGEFEKAKSMLIPIFKKDKNWQTLLPRLKSSELLAIKDQQMEELIKL